MKKIILPIVLLAGFFINTGMIEAALNNDDSRFRSLFLKKGSTANIADTSGESYTDYGEIIRSSMPVLAGLAVAAFIYWKWNESKRIPLDPQGFLALCASGKLRRIRIALRKGANVNTADDSGKTALMYAASRNRNPKVITLLLKNGADAQTRDRRGKTAADYAGGNDKIAVTEVYKQLRNAVRAPGR
ncbi:hypothetical protein FACS1894204_06070 [Synergistales bacterium]|nr:hypothetical protein FACS1894204_06070 [Synergistales bacterium]